MTTSKLTLEMLQKVREGNAAAFRSVTEYPLTGGPGNKVFPLTYEGGKSAVETRLIHGTAVPLVQCQ